nr:hypothetical protein [Tanacetum cinerariifolium]
MAAEGPGDLPVPDLQTMEELCQPSLNGRGGPIASIAIQATNFGLKNDMIQQVQNSCHFHGLSGDDANKHLDKFLYVTQSIKVNGVIDDALRLYLFPHSLTHHAIAWFDRLPRNSINTFEQMAKMFFGKYFPPSMVTKLRNEITNFYQRPDESLFEAWERGTFMKRRPEECYDLIENTTANHNDWDTSAHRSESSSSITSSSDMKIAVLKAEMAKINKKLLRVLQVNQQVKAVTPNCETCGGPHSFNDCLATIGNTQNVYVAGAYQELSEPKQESRKHNPRGNNQGRNQFFQGASHSQNPPLAYQAPTYQAPASDSILKNMQTNMTSLTNSNLELKNMFGQFMKINTASSLGSGTLPCNTITNPKEDLKGITTRSGTSYQGPTIPTTSSFLPPIVERETEATKDMVHPTNNGSTKDVQPLVVQTESLILNSKHVIAPIIELVASPSLLTNKDKLFELARTPLNEHFSTVLLKKLPEKLGDFGKFLIPCDFSEMAECLALADLGASINLMPLSVWNKLSLAELTPTLMTLKLADRSISRPIGVAEDVYVKVGKFHFLADFVVVDFDADPRVPLILGRSYLKIERDLIDVFEGKLTLCVGKEAITLNLDQTSRYLANYNDMTANRIDVIDMACEEYSQEVIGFSDVISSGNPTPYYDPVVSTTYLTQTPFKNSDFLLEEVDAFLALEDDPTSPEVDQSYELKICEAKTDKSSIDEPPEVKLNDLPPHLGYAFLEGDDKLPVIIAKDLSVEEKTALTTVSKSHKRAIAWKLSDIKGVDPEFCTHKILMEEDFKPGFNIREGSIRKSMMSSRMRCMMAIFHDMIEKTMEVFMDDFLVFENSFQTCLSHLEKILKRCEDTNLCLNWEKSHFMVKEGIVLDHKISKNGIEVDKAKVDVIAKFPHSTTVKGIHSFLGHADFYRRFIQDFSKIARPMTHLLQKYTLFFFSKECVEAFKTLKRKLTEAPILISPDWDLPFELMCDASDFAICAVLGKRQEKHFRPIYYASKTMTEAESNYTTTEKEMLAVVYAFEKFWSYLIMNKRVVYTDHSALKYLFAKKDSKARLLRWLLLLQEFTFKVIDTKGAENLSVDHLSRLEKPHQNMLDLKEINESFPLETLNLVSFHGNSSTPCDRGTHFCNDQFAKVMLKFGVTYRLATPYHPQTSGPVESHEASSSSLYKSKNSRMLDHEAHYAHYAVASDDHLREISILLAVGTPSTGSGNLYCQWELSPGSGNALCILFPTFTVVENEENELIPTRLVTGWRVCIDYRKLNEATRTDHFPLPSMDQMLERFARNDYYCFLDGFFGYFQIPIDPKDQEKTTFTCPYETFAYRCMPFGLCNAPGTFQRCMMAIFHDMIEKTMERCEDTNLYLNWEKSHFMVKEGIVLDHKISKNGIEVDKAKVDVIAKLPHSTTVKGIRSFLGHADFYRRFIQDFSKIARPMTRLLQKDTLFFFSKECVEAFQTLKRKLTEAPILISPDWDLPFELMCDASDFAICAFLGQRQEKHFRPIYYASKTMTEA